ncbi:hypothetical protein LVB87_15370 [Lysobacter sp. KIS68-7]|uniref:hypothetical protein n=1 Tax=Lysobacter sp. KIS68-7 TaxID=2904252 RepID=UPI001E400E39|nr:hypothetical protein [Lysobacter sp. KIS68-7]UHQ19547.1 hypothetical protein LVB87_15370 [Lysobacter sp. KIS68-7]
MADTNRWRIAIWGMAGGLLALPMVAMQFTREVQWTALDFTTFGTMLLVACGSYELATRKSGSVAYRAAAALAIATAFCMVWINLAVGIIGDERNPANLVFAGVLVAGIVGAVVARFQAGAMVRAMVATAVVQALVGGIALFAGSMEGAVLSGLFVGAWLVSAWLFARAAKAG